MRFALLEELLLAPSGDVRLQATFDSETFKPIDAGIKRVGRPRVHWFIIKIEAY